MNEAESNSLSEFGERFGNAAFNTAVTEIVEAFSGDYASGNRLARVNITAEDASLRFPGGSGLITTQSERVAIVNRAWRNGPDNTSTFEIKRLEGRRRRVQAIPTNQQIQLHSTSSSEDDFLQWIEDIHRSGSRYWTGADHYGLRRRYAYGYD